MTVLMPIDATPPKSGGTTEQTDVNVVDTVSDFAALLVVEEVVVTPKAVDAPVDVPDPKETPDVVPDQRAVPDAGLQETNLTAGLVDPAMANADQARPINQPIVASVAEDMQRLLDPKQYPGMGHSEKARPHALGDQPMVPKRAIRDQLLSAPDPKTAQPEIKAVATSDQKSTPPPVSFVQSVVQQQMPVSLMASAQLVPSPSRPIEPAAVLSGTAPDTQQVQTNRLNPAAQLPQSSSLMASPLSQATKPDPKPGRHDKEMPDPDKIRMSATDRASAKSVATAPTATGQLPALQPIVADLQNPMLITQSGDSEVLPSLTVSDRAIASQSSTIIASAPAQGGEIARQVTHQIAQAVIQHHGRVTEIALNPEELGRLRLSMSAVDTAITLSVAADRPETADLLRRHIDVLTQEFRSLGYDDITFSFEGDNQSESDRDKQMDGPGNDTSAQDETVLPPLLQPMTGLDLRL